ncbi:glutamate racemase [Magnetospirillum sp. 64-120]|uniref:glutamate racemase n=1 Tax=Magnetospirillum sp. 64-120 TaxID=1895778 RepID=UPI0009283FF2|nr:glutamate racemase [Magnetospirillum sp. 64-120]OJX79522.1 MAG: glutamate racemase [Magnetospirillum sp. 64-120]
MTADRDLPIGVFDSGVGGLTVLKALRERLPGESLIYLGDTARLPYGTKSAAAVSHYALQAAHALVRMGIKTLVVADNTSSAHALEALRAEFPGLPVIGVVEPGASAAALASAQGRIVVIATDSTVQAGTYPRAIHNSRPGAQVISKACPLFVSMVEEGMTDGPIAEQLARHYLDPLFQNADDDSRGDCLLLGCTHFPALSDLLRRVTGPDTAIIDSATTTARAVEDLLEHRGLATRRDRSRARVRYLATDAPERFARVARIFVPWTITPDEVEVVDLA